ncbi:hypothetical protein ACFX2B_036780 [Malus domestica]
MLRCSVIIPGSSAKQPQALGSARFYDIWEPIGSGSGSGTIRKRIKHKFDGFDRRKGTDRYNKDGRGYDRNLMHRSESLSASRRSPTEFSKRF